MRVNTMEARKRDLAFADRSEEYMPTYAALAAEALAVSHPHPKAPRAKTGIRRRQARSVWLLVTWLAISVSMIAGAGGLIAMYF